MIEARSKTEPIELASEFQFMTNRVIRYPAIWQSDHLEGTFMRADGRKPLLLYLKPDLIRRLKKLALDDETHLYLLLEPILEDFVAARENGAETGSVNNG